MSSDITNHILRRQYLAYKGDDLLSQVQRVICVITPNAFVSAGFHPSGEVLVVDSSLLDASRWNASFIEYELLNDPLLAAPEQIRSIYVASVKNIIIPDELYSSEDIARQWLKALFHCEADEQTEVHHLERNETHTCFSYPESIRDIFGKYTSGLSILPLNLTHFSNNGGAESLLQCTVTDGYAIGTLHHKNTLHWHQTFEYQNAEDIAYKLASACRHFGIDLQSCSLNINATSIEQHTILKKLNQYLPALQSKAGISDLISPEWSATIRLFQQLYACA